MKKFRLCESCASRFNSKLIFSADNAGCHICHGCLASIPGMISSAISQSSQFEWESFAVSSKFPKSAMVAEQEVMDLLQPGESTSMKNSVNSELSRRVADATKKKNNARRPDMLFEFNFILGKASATPAQIFIFGHYIKLSRKHCQSRWHCSECKGKGCDSCGGSGRNYPSVEDELGNVFSSAFGASGCTLHASGREDVDVRMLGNGRPFVMELAAPKKRNVDLGRLELQLSDNPSARAVGLRKVGKHFLDSVCNSHFEKEYSAIVASDRPLGKQDALKTEALSGKTIFQNTPKRVLARRADLERKRKIISISASVCGSGRLRLSILAEAGTYIKELISSDGGRTKPSISGALGCQCICEELDVISIRDYFLQTISD